MTDEERLEAVLAAVTGAMVGTAEDLAVDLERLENGLVEAGVNVTATTNRGALAAELSVLREEAAKQRVRLRHSVREAKPDAGELSDLIRRLDAREKEIVERLWPSR